MLLGGFEPSRNTSKTKKAEEKVVVNKVVAVPSTDHHPLNLNDVSVFDRVLEGRGSSILDDEEVAKTLQIANTTFIEHTLKTGGIQTPINETQNNLLSQPEDLPNPFDDDEPKKMVVDSVALIENNNQGKHSVNQETFLSPVLSGGVSAAPPTQAVGGGIDDKQANRQQLISPLSKAPPQNQNQAGTLSVNKQSPVGLNKQSPGLVTIQIGGRSSPPEDNKVVNQPQDQTASVSVAAAVVNKNNDWQSNDRMEKDSSFKSEGHNNHVIKKQQKSEKTSAKKQHLNQIGNVAPNECLVINIDCDSEEQNTASADLCMTSGREQETTAAGAPDEEDDLIQVPNSRLISSSTELDISTMGLEQSQNQLAALDSSSSKINQKRMKKLSAKKQQQPNQASPNKQQHQSLQPSSPTKKKSLLKSSSNPQRKLLALREAFRNRQTQNEGIGLSLKDILNKDRQLRSELVDRQTSNLK